MGSMTGIELNNRQLPPMDQVQAVLFDVDGTLADSDPLHYAAFRDLLVQTGYNGGVPITEEFFSAFISGKHNSDIGVFLFPDWDQQRRDQWLDDKETHFRRLVLEFFGTRNFREHNTDTKVHFELILSEENIQRKSFTPFPKKAKSSAPPVVGADPVTEDAEEEEKVKGIKVADYKYLLLMPIGSLTFERVEQLRAERDKMEDDVEELKKSIPKQLWEKDLDEFLVNKLDAQEAQEEIDAAYEAKHSAKEGNHIVKRPAPKKPAVPKAKKIEPVDDDVKPVPAPAGQPQQLQWKASLSLPKLHQTSGEGRPEETRQDSE